MQRRMIELEDYQWCLIIMLSLHSELGMFRLTLCVLMLHDSFGRIMSQVGRTQIF